MKRTNRITGIAAVLLSLFALSAGADELGTNEVASILSMTEEEKLAHDVYLALSDEWNSRVFANIARAEERHMDAMLALVDSYGLVDPVQEAGMFTNAELQELYDELVARGTRSIEEAYRVGALVEEVDIDDLISAMEETEAADVRLVYERLLAGSTNHLRAFVGQLERLGVTYEPVVLQGSEFDAILDTATARAVVSPAHGGRGRDGTAPRARGRSQARDLTGGRGRS